MKLNLMPPSQMSNFTLKDISTPYLGEIERKKSGGKIIFIREGLIAKKLYAYEDTTSKTICLEVTISKMNWCITFAYIPPYNNTKEDIKKYFLLKISI